MAWTHYWQRDEYLDETAFSQAVKDCRILLAAVDIPLSGQEAEGEPVFQNDEIIFNGVQGQACEPFIIRIHEQPRIQGRPVFAYCKTEKLPYDLAVRCALIILKHHLGDSIRVMSDAPESAWNDAKQLCLSCLGYGSDFALDSES